MLPFNSNRAIPQSDPIPESNSGNANLVHVQPGGLRLTLLRIVLGFLVPLVIFSSTAEAQKYVFNNGAFPAGLRPVWVVTGDFNSDGLADVAVVNQFGSDPADISVGTVSILLGNPDGTLQSHVDYAIGNSPRFVIAGDFNGDGKTDLAVANIGSNTISILLGNGDGTFQSHVDYPAGASPVSIVAGDFNRDGKLDLAVANSGSNSISILLGNGDGTFRSHVDYATSFAPTSVATADFNGDGKLDLAVADLNVSVLLGNGDGTFQPPAEYPGNGASFVTVGDFNGDGKMDLAATEGFGDSIAILLGRGDGTFPTSPVSYEVGGGPESIIPIDLNGDGHVDLAVAAGAGGGGPNVSGTLSILLNKGDGTFQPHRDFGGMTVVSVAAADFNGDGHLDVAIPNRDFNTVNILLGDGHGAFGSIFDSLTPNPPLQVVTGDFNSDGKIDLLFGIQGSGSVGVALGNGDGTFQPPVFDSAPGGGLSVTTGDFNGDGKLDVAAFVGSELNNIQILLGNGDGTFKSRLSFPVSNNPGQVLAADFNGDGKLDLVVVGFGFDVMLGKGDGTFQSPMSFPSHLSSGALLSDFNADGKLDLALVSSGSGTVTVFLGNGNGTFQPGVDYSTGTAPTGIVAADFNGDGKIDLAVANTADNTIPVFLGNGDGTFKPHVDFPTVQSLRSLAAGDFDGDGKTDLMAVGNGLSFLFGNGDGTFQSHQDYFMSIDVASVIKADFNGDGRSDLAIANAFASTISVVLNLPAVALRPRQLSFPSQFVGTQGTAQTVTIYNPGIVPLSIQSIAASSDFSETGSCAGSVAAGANCLTHVSFSPAAGGDRAGTLTINDNAVGSPQTVSLAGTATDFSLGVATGSNCPAGGNCSTSASVNAGQVATYNLQVMAIGGFSGTVTFSCSGAPSSATCNVSPAAVNVTGSSALSFVVNISTPKSTLSGPWTKLPRSFPSRRLRLTPPLLFAFATVLLAFLTMVAKRTRRTCIPALALVLLTLVSAAGCSGGGSVKNRTSTVTITGSSNGVNRTVNLTLTVN